MKKHFQTPMMKQYRKIKKSYKDCLLFFRLGDFYELFLEDAEIGARILDITLTARHKGKDGKIPMCGIPYHSIDAYLPKIVKAGYKAAICEQVSEANGAQIVDREVVRIITSGTLTDEKMLDSKNNNYLLTISFDPKSKSTFFLAYTDISTGKFFVSEHKTNKNQDLYDSIQNELLSINPSEIVLPIALYENYELLKKIQKIGSFNISRYREYKDTYKESLKRLKEFFNIKSLDIYNISENNQGMILSSAFLLAYLQYTQKEKLFHIKKITNITDSLHMKIDSDTFRNLEIFVGNRARQETSNNTNLISIIDKTNTPMGARMLRSLILRPSIDINEIKTRQNATEQLINNHNLRENITQILKKVLDIERLLSKIGTGNANARDLNALKISLLESLNITEQVKKSEEITKTLQIRKTQINKLQKTILLITKKIDQTLVLDPPVTIKEGNMIKADVNKELDDIKDSIKDSQEWITKLEAKEKTRTKIPTLKVGFNSVFGYYIEVSKANSRLVPPNYIRKQTLVNSERYITDELKYKEEIVLNAQEKINKLEYEIFKNLVKSILQYTEPIQNLANIVSIIDYLTSFAILAIENNYTKPKISPQNTFTLKIKEGRHPVIETTLESGEFTPNDTLMNKSNSFHIITGPNMSGKSTYIRQTAIIQLLAQIGSHVPAYEATISLVDGIYTRIGASDALAQGLSTFMVEMIETAKILHNATNNSLIILDEVGRGTSTLDGLSIARAVVEYIHNKIKAKTLFATHFHELVGLEQRFKRIENHHIKVLEESGEIKFLHKVEKGGTDKSYGIEVAKLAGIPDEVVSRATDIIEKNSTSQLKLELL